MKTKKEIESLLKSYETRLDNIEREFISKGSHIGYDDYWTKTREYRARIQTCKVILK